MKIDIEIIERVLDNRATPEEAKMVVDFFREKEGYDFLTQYITDELKGLTEDKAMSWLDHNVPELRMKIRFLDQIKQSEKERLRGRLLMAPSVEVERYIAEVPGNIGQGKQKKKRFHFWISVVSAAALIGIVYLGLKYEQEEVGADISTVAARMMEKVISSEEIQLIVSSDEVVALEENAEVANTQSGAITVNKKQVVDAHEENAADLYAQIIVPKGKHTRLILADGSHIHINAGTKVIYPRRFKKDKREIYVDGEIFIDVQPNKEVPFFVRTSHFEVKVLGTAFNVSAYGVDKHAEVTLVRGSVQLKDSKEQVMTLIPDQQAELKEGLLHDKKTVNAEDYMAWTQGLLILQGEPLSRVFNRLERYYGEEIIADVAIQELTIRGSLDLEHPLEEILSRIAIITPIEFIKTSQGFLVGKKGE